MRPAARRTLRQFRRPMLGGPGTQDGALVKSARFRSYAPNEPPDPFERIALSTLGPHPNLLIQGMQR
jgi:hypothetical protein